MSNGSSDVSAEQMEILLELDRIFRPQAWKQLKRVYKMQESGVVDGCAKFVHYTSAKAALGIINTKRMWMRNAMCMSDYSEVQHGYSIFQKFLSDNSKAAAFFTALEACAPGAAQEAIDQFDQSWKGVQCHTYIASISEHDPSEDLHGRLSMWRAFGGDTARVAVVVNIPWNSGGAQALNVVFSPVAYLTEREAHAEIEEVIANITARREFLRSLDRRAVITSIFRMLLVGVTCLKHEGFREEREWRAIYMPDQFHSPLMKSSTKLVGGIPQLIYKIPLDETDAPVLSGLEFSRIFDRVIIGPSAYSLPMYDAFSAAIAEAGVSQDTERVFISGIPIRA